MSSQYTRRGTDALLPETSTAGVQDTLSTSSPCSSEEQPVLDIEQGRVQEYHHPSSVILRHDTDRTTNVDVVRRTGSPPHITTHLSLPLDGINFGTAAAVASLPDLTHLTLRPSIIQDSYANLDVEPLLQVLNSLSSLSQVSLCVNALRPDDTERVLNSLQRLPTMTALEMVLSSETVHGISNQRSLMTLTLEVYLIRGIEFFLQLTNVTIPGSLLTELMQGALGRLPNLQRLRITVAENDNGTCELGCSIASHLFSKNLQQYSPLDRPFASLEFLDLGSGDDWHNREIRRYLPHVTIHHLSPFIV